MDPYLGKPTEQWFSKKKVDQPPQGRRQTQANGLAPAYRGTTTIVKVDNGSRSQVPRALLKVEDARMRLWGETQKDNVFLIQTRQSTTSLPCSNLSAAISSLTLRSLAGLVEVSGLSPQHLERLHHCVSSCCLPTT